MNSETSFVRGISFGCSNLLGDKTPDQGLALLGAAYDAGIRSFDVARVYNFGDAERLVGQFASSRRSELTITTKFGLMPNANIAKMGGIVNVVRRVMRSSTFIRKLVRRNVGKMTQKGRFDVPTAEASLEESLRALNTDYIDTYLLHEAGPVDCTDELFEFLSRAKQQGKILSFGIGSGYHTIPSLVAATPRFLPVTQFNSSAVDDNCKAFLAMRPAENELVITHGSFGGTDPVRDAISAKAPETKQWSDRVGFDLTASGVIHAALLRCALRSNAGGKVIFRASTPDRISANMSGLNRSFSDQQLDALEALCREKATPAS